MTSLTATHNLSSIRSAKLSKYSVPFKTPMLFKGHTLTVRQGYLIELQFADGTMGRGEISPLPGFSHETLEDCYQQIIDWFNHLPSSLAQLPSLPSVAFAIDCALSRISTDKPASLSNDQTPLLIGSNDEVIQSYKQLNTPSRIKLKAARQTAKDDAELVNALQTVNSKLQCIMDANQGWTLTQAMEFASLVEKSALFYIEEPCQHYQQTIEFANSSGIAIALDETLQDPNFDFIAEPMITALVLKPSLIGSFKRCEHLIDAAKHNKIACYLSSSFESPMGINQLHQLGNIWTPKQATGLDTEKYFLVDKLETEEIARWQFQK